MATVVFPEVSVTPIMKEFLMGRGKFDPREFGVELDREVFMDRVVEEFNSRFRGQMTIDELLLHPRESILFCDHVRHIQGWFVVPDDIILRSVLTRRKNP